jgi:hypothetical protein
MLIASCWLHVAEQYLVTETAFSPSLTGEFLQVGRLQSSELHEKIVSGMQGGVSKGIRVKMTGAASSLGTRNTGLRLLWMFSVHRRLIRCTTTV